MTELLTLTETQVDEQVTLLVQEIESFLTNVGNLSRAQRRQVVSLAKDNFIQSEDNRP